ncbi:MAG: XdhC family protein, partial [Betaproteobacteria bacterium]
MNATALKQLASQWLALGHSAVLVELRGVKGSAPRDAGTRMVVTAETCWGTIGGGHLEWMAQATARQLLSGTAAWPTPQRLALGPTLGQCCG